MLYVGIFSPLSDVKHNSIILQDALAEIAQHWTEEKKISIQTAIFFSMENVLLPLSLPSPSVWCVRLIAFVNRLMTLVKAVQTLSNSFCFFKLHKS